MRNHVSRYAIVGLLLAILIVPATPVQAQFTVWDPTNYALTAREENRRGESLAGNGSSLRHDGRQNDPTAHHDAGRSAQR